ncbi:MAG: ABC transporter permease subunit, partial [Gammaproteobacteria bacterium]|nr:ABC transporter permease subunit [Gammaproteobacteria bacterium]
MGTADLATTAETSVERRGRRRSGRLVLYLLLVVGAVVMILPFGYMIGTALSPDRWIMPYPPTLWPEGATLDNFARAWNEAGLQRYMLNSAIVSVVTVVLTLAVASTSAFAFARLRFPGRELIFGLYLITMMIPDMIALLPKFQVMRDFGLTNSWMGLWIVYVSGAVAFNTFLLRAFFQRVPSELEDAVQIDGGGPWTFYWRVLIPLTKPALAVVAVFTFLAAWDDFWWARLLIQTPELRTLPLGILLFFNAHGTQWSTVFAATTLAAIPEILVFVFLQRYFVTGLYT